MRDHVLFLIVLLALVAGCAGTETPAKNEKTATTKKPPPARATAPKPERLPPGVEAIRKNRNGLREYMHRESGIIFVRVPAGSYVRGAQQHDDLANPDERPVRTIEVDEFLLSKYEVTNAQWNRHRKKITAKYEEFALDDTNQPVVLVSWNDVMRYCKKFQFKLPTEDEWEYAARAGTASRFAWGAKADGGAGWGNVADRSAGVRFQWTDIFAFDDKFPTSAPVGRFRANRFGLHDMEGNVSEWCADGADLHGGPPTTSARAAYRSFRGGAWTTGPRHARLSTRFMERPASAFKGVGFRVAMDLPG